MRALKIMLMIVLVAAFASTAIGAQTVTINGVTTNCTSGTLTLSGTGMAMDCNGNVILNVTCSGGTPSACTDFNYSVWGACQSNNTQTRTYSGYLPAGCTGTPSGTPVLSQSCTYGSIQGKNIKYATGGQTFTIDPNGTQLWYGTLVNDCTTGYKRLYFYLTQQQSAPNVDMVVKKTNGDYSNPPTIADYNNLMVQDGYNGSGTFTPDGVLFEAFTPIPSAEVSIIYVPSYYTQFNIGSRVDTYYVLLVNTTNEPAPGYINFYCQ